MPRFLSRLLRTAAPAADHVPDAELLRRFASDRDSAALELVVRRHAGAVWAACRRVLPAEADAEDAFQAAFLALIRRAGAVRSPCAGGWLHRVAVRAALKLRARSARTRPTDPSHLDGPAPDLVEPDSDRAAIVHEELDRLPDRERLPLILCDLEGLSHADAARALGWPVGTVSGRLSRARAKLRDRLARRGLDPSSAAALPLAFAPPHLVPKAVSLMSNPAAPAVASLTEGVLRAMLYTKLKVAAVVAATGLALAVGIGTGFALAPGGAPTEALAPAEPLPQEPKPAPKVEPPRPKAADESKDANALTLFPELTADGLADLGKACPILFGEDELIFPKDPPRRQLLKAMLNTARFELNAALRRYQAGAGSLEMIRDPAERVIAAAAALDRANLVPALKERVRVAKIFEKMTADGVAAGRVSRTDAFQARYIRLSAELALLDAIEAAKKPIP